MRLPLRLRLLVRFAYGLFAAVSAFYCLLAWIPFTWQQVIQGHLLPALNAFAVFHPWLNLVALGLLAMATWEKRTSHRWFLGIQLCLASLYVFRPVLASLANEVSSLFWAALLILPLPWQGLLEVKANLPLLNWSPRPASGDSRAFYASWRAVLFCAAVAALIPVMVFRSPVAILWATAAHFVIFCWVFVALALAAGFASFFSRPARFDFVLVQAFLCCLLYLVFARKIFPAISFEGTLAGVCAAVLGISLCFYATGLTMKIAVEQAIVPETGLDLAILPLTVFLPSRSVAYGVTLAIIGVGTTAASRSASSLDWNYLIQELIAFLCWTLTFAVFYRLSGVRKTRLKSTVSGLLIALCVTISYAGAYSRFSPTALLNNYSGYNISFRLASELLSPPAEDGTFYAFLNASSNIPRSVPVRPVNIDLAGPVTASTAKKPNIFIIVVDSLRRDYLGIYNSSVHFTPFLDAFARESSVFRNAFTHYGGTGLSEPSIWLGGMMLHKQYVTPFGPMNTLAKLVSVESYSQRISRDTILDALLPRSPRMTDLDAGRLTMDLDLCASLEELEEKRKATEPVFAYTQAQNLHISVIARQGKSVPPGESYPGFYAPYASRLRRIDACFGQFVSELKAEGIYDSSIIVFTADHGDSLGEEGRWGHAYTIFPEIVRIPLIVHVPASLQAHLAASSGRVVFSTDITPTIYEALGHVATSPGEMFGHSLLGPVPANPSYLVASSYAAVYGLLSREGKRLYISDAVAARDYSYDLTSGPAGRQLDIRTEERTTSHKRIQQLIEEINASYSFRPQRQ